MRLHLQGDVDFLSPSDWKLSWQNIDIEMPWLRGRLPEHLAVATQSMLDLCPVGFVQQTDDQIIATMIQSENQTINHHNDSLTEAKRIIKIQSQSSSSWFKDSESRDVTSKIMKHPKLNPM